MNEEQKSINVFEMSGYQFNKYFSDTILPNLIDIASANVEYFSEHAKNKKIGITPQFVIGKYPLYIGLFIMFLVLPKLFLVCVVIWFIAQFFKKDKPSWKDKNETLNGEIRKKVFSYFNIDIKRNLEQHPFDFPMLKLMGISGYKVEDVLDFTYKDLPIQISETLILDKGQNPLASVISFSTKLNKNFKGRTTIGYAPQNSGRGGPPLIQMNKQANASAPIYIGQNFSSVEQSSQERVLLEDVVFNEKFYVFSSDQVEARYLLTPTFMNRMLKYNTSQTSCITTVLFDNMFSPTANVFLTIYTGKDFFENSADPLSAKVYWDILQDIKEIVQVVEGLKLDQDIGM